jgi:hypothetical protein
MIEQLALDQLHGCPTCGGTGRRDDREHDGTRPCPICQGTGTVDYDPDDPTIPY